MKTTTKRSVAILALAVLLALSATPLFAQAKKVVEIQVWAHWASEQRRPTINAMIEEFNRLYESKGIKAVYTPVAFDEIQKKLLASIAAKDPPDVAISSIEEVTIRALKKRATDITKYLPKDLKDKYYSSLWEAVTYKGKVYALPFNTDNRFLFYNKKMFAEAGITTLPKTWAELLAIADKLDKKDASGAYTQYAFFPTLGNFGFDSFAYANGAFLFSDPMNPKTPTINSKANIEALEYMTKWRARYGADTYNTMTANLGSGINDLFISGKVAILGNVCNYIATLQRYAPTMDYGVMALPAGPSAKKAYTPGGGFVVEVPYGSKHVAEAAEFVKFMTGDWAASKWGLDQKDVMANIAANENPAMSTSPAWSLVKELLPVTQVTRRLATAPTASAIKDKWVDLVIKQGTEMPAAALNKAQEELLKTIKENEELGF